MLVYDWFIGSLAQSLGIKTILGILELELRSWSMINATVSVLVYWWNSVANQMKADIQSVLKPNIFRSRTFSDLTYKTASIVDTVVYTTVATKTNPA